MTHDTLAPHPAATAPAPGAETEPELAGGTFIVNVDTGLTARQEYSADGRTVTLTVLVAGESGVPEGPCGTVEVFHRRIGFGTYHVGWVETNGVAICNVQDLAAGTVSNFVSKPGEQGAQPHGELHEGTIRRVG